ncbi:hypothetical protein PG985_002581 [Apiospora marii]|uniref:Uncharacterized protein n=1 Tax=Apiospora marii TaxID=335849 RepID=A0ABR1RTA1_9PEZI
MLIPMLRGGESRQATASTPMLASPSPRPSVKASSGGHSYHATTLCPALASPNPTLSGGHQRNEHDVDDDSWTSVAEIPCTQAPTDGIVLVPVGTGASHAPGDYSQPAEPRIPHAPAPLSDANMYATHPSTMGVTTHQAPVLSYGRTSETQPRYAPGSLVSTAKISVATASDIAPSQPTFLPTSTRASFQVPLTGIPVHPLSGSTVALLRPTPILPDTSATTLPTPSSDTVIAIPVPSDTETVLGKKASEHSSPTTAPFSPKTRIPNRSTTIHSNHVSPFTSRHAPSYSSTSVTSVTVTSTEPFTSSPCPTSSAPSTQEAQQNSTKSGLSGADVAALAIGMAIAGLHARKQCEVGVSGNGRKQTGAYAAGVFLGQSVLQGKIRMGVLTPGARITVYPQRSREEPLRELARPAPALTIPGTGKRNASTTRKSIIDLIDPCFPNFDRNLIVGATACCLPT